MAKKFYAVRIGKTPGIYETWDACKEQVSGFSGAVYKSFQSRAEADAFLEGNASANVSLEVENLKEDEAIAYVDGSYLDGTKEYSWGVVMLHQGKELHFSGKSDTKNMVEMRNVAGEISGSMEAMKYCREQNCRKLVIVHDYEGIAKWCQGVWKTNKDGTKAYKAFYDEMSEHMEIAFQKVKGHSGDHYNDLADQLAKSALGIL